MMTGYSSGSPEGRKRYLDEWTVELRKKALEEDRRSETRERAKMGEEDSSSRRHGVGENSGTTSTLTFLERSALNLDAGPGVVRCSGTVVSRHAADLRTGLLSGDNLVSAKALLWRISTAFFTRWWILWRAFTLRKGPGCPVRRPSCLSSPYSS